MMHIWFEQTPWKGVVSIFIAREQAVPDYQYTQPHLLLQQEDGSYEFVRQPEGFVPTVSSFDLSQAEAQEMFERLWHLGFRSNQYIDEASRLEAVAAHLADMRAIAFSKLNIPSPETAKKGTY